MVEEEVKDKMTVHLTELNDRLDNMVFENGDIKDRLDKVENQLKKEKERTKSALERSNYNEQFSRKNNVKIMGVEVLEDETEVKLTAEILRIIKEKIDVDIEASEIVTIHRIPSKHDPKTVLVKLKNNSEKTRLMKHRRIMKQQGHKLVDDVTKKNTELISRLQKHEKIDSAWFSMVLYMEKPPRANVTALIYILTLMESSVRRKKVKMRKTFLTRLDCEPWLSIPDVNQIYILSKYFRFVYDCELEFEIVKKETICDIVQ